MAHKKGLGSSRNGRDSNAKRLGVKVFAGEVVEPDEDGRMPVSASESELDLPLPEESLAEALDDAADEEDDGDDAVQSKPRRRGRRGGRRRSRATADAAEVSEASE